MKHLNTAIAATLCLSMPLHADGHFWGQWQHGPTEFMQYGAWVSELENGRLITATVLCAEDVPYLTVAWLQGETEQAEAQMQIAVDGRPYRLVARYFPNAAEPAWTVRLAPEVIDALRGGSSFTVQVVERGPSTLRLNGSASAIDAALQGCGNGQGYQPAWANFFSFTAPDGQGSLQPVADLGDPAPTNAPPQAPTDVIPANAPISRAELEAAWAEHCPTGPTASDGAVRTADLDGDGIRDVIVNTAAIRCEGGAFSVMQGLGFCGMHNCTLFIYLSSTYQPGTWPELIQNHMEIPPELVETNGPAILTTAVQGGACDFAEICRGSWQWNGAELAFSPAQ